MKHSKNKPKKLWLVALLLMLFCVTALSAGAASSTWDGSAAYDFASGLGTETNPYIIKTAEQLAYFAQSVNAGNTYEGQYIKLDADIELNDAVFFLDLDSGLVVVRYYGYSYITAYLGTGILGDASGSNTTFDTTASTAGAWYSSTTSTATTTYSGTLNTWKPIGSSSYPFAGNFDGDGHTVSGLYIETAEDYQGLFGSIKNATVANLGVVNSYIRANDYVGAVVGYCEAYDSNGGHSVIENCYSTSIVNGNYEVGGVVGRTRAMCDSYSGTPTVTVKNCYNIGTIYSKTGSAGGVVGKNEYNGLVEDCYNVGTIIGGYYVGGVVGRNSYAVVESCYNTGDVSGDTEVGGVVGRNELVSVVTNSYNKGNVTGSKSSVGGIVGLSITNTYDGIPEITNCYNTGNVSVIGEYSDSVGNFVGGIVGENYASSKSYIVTVENCYNTGSIVGNKYVGGILGGNDSAGKFSKTNCYNTGSVSGNSYVGGIVGYDKGYQSPNINCYNAGTVTASSDIDGIAGYYSYSSQIQNCYYLDTAVTAASKYGTALTDDQMKLASSFAGFDFDTVWEIDVTCGYDYPTLQEPIHEGEHVTDASIWKKDTSSHWHECACGENQSDVSAHEYDNLCDPTCNTCNYERALEISDADFISYQVTKGENGAFSLRAIAGLNSLDYKNFGYEITITTKDESGNDVVKTLSGATTKAYSSIFGGTTEYSIKEHFGYEYAGLATVTGLAVDSEYTKLEIRSYVTTLDGEVKYGKSATLLYTGVLDESEFPTLELVTE